MNILFLTQYFPPEIGAPQNRLYELAVRLKKKGAEVSILTAMPNYPSMVLHENYKGKFYSHEIINNLEVHRSFIFVKKSSSLFLRLGVYFSFVITSLLVGIFKIKNQDFIFCESPPLFLGITALVLKKLKKAKLIFNVSDLWPESAEKLGLVTNKFLLNTATKLEEIMYKNSFLITGQTQGIVKNISSRFPGKRVHWLKNGIDTARYEKENHTNWRKQSGFSDEDFLLLYAGIIGFAQGLEVILHTADLLKEYSKIKFIILGDGPEKQKLINLKLDLGLKNVFFLDPITKDEMPEVTASVSASIIPLKKIELFRGAIPSKIFEICASKKPILLGIEGEAKDLFILEGQCGLSFDPENAEDLSNKILELYNSPSHNNNLGKNGFDFVRKHFDLDNIASEFWNLINTAN